MSSSLARPLIGLAIAALVVGGFAMTRGGTADGELRTATVTRAPLKQTIVAPGAMTTAGDVRLAFKVPGKLAQVSVTVGQRVAAGQPLAKLDTTDLEIALAQAQASVQSAQARYDQVAAGASPEDVNLARQAVDNATRTLEETRRTADNDVATAQQSLSRIRNGYAASKTTFTSLAQSVGNDVGAFQSTVAAAKQQTGPLNTEIQNSARQTNDVLAARNAVLQADASIATAVSASTGQLAAALDDYAAARDGLVAAILKFDSALAAGADTSGLGSDYQLAAVGYGAAAAQQRSTAVVVTAQNGLGSAQASLTRTAAAPRAFDIAAAYAAILGAQAVAQQAQANLDSATLRSPSAAVVAQVNNRVGEQLAPAGSFIVLQNVSAFVLHVTVGESAIAMLEVGQPATITIDALGKATVMNGRVTAIDPGATVQLGVSVYGADVTLDAPDARVRSGMSGSAAVVVASKADALVVPALAVRTTRGRHSVQILREGKPVDADVTIGISADGMTEIASGLGEGDRVVVPEPRTLLR